MKKYLLGLLLALVSCLSFADYVASQGTDSITLREGVACTGDIAKNINPEMLKRFGAGSAQIEGKKYALCWAQVEDKVFVIYEDGDSGFLPVGIFRKLKDV